MMSVVRAVGIAWYYRQDYGRILDIMEDAHVLPRKYDAWLKSAETGEREMKAKGFIVVRAVIDPAEFAPWCRARGLNVDAKARMQFANEMAHAQVRSTH